MFRFSPVAGIQWVETCVPVKVERSSTYAGFSPVAGIQWVETDKRPPVAIVLVGFSPVAGIQWVETQLIRLEGWLVKRCFSPVAGIQWVETVASWI